MKRARGYVASLNSELRFTEGQRDFLKRRTRPFIDQFGMDRPLSLIVQEVYLQGVRDAAEVLLECDPPTDKAQDAIPPASEASPK